VPQVIESDDEELHLDDEVIPNTNTQLKKKRKTSQDIGEKVTKDTGKVEFVTSMRNIERLVEAAEVNNDIAGPSYVCGQYSIPSCIEVLKNIQREGLLNDRQFSYALELLRNSQSRVIFMSLKDSHNALVNWILYKYDL
jgi:tRNA G26 N,N-dimethylase Trm1